MNQTPLSRSVLLALLATVLVYPSPGDAQSTSYPARRAGLWEMRIQVLDPATGKETGSVPGKQCVDEKSDRLLQGHALFLKGCRSTTIAQGAGLLFEAQCNSDIPVSGRDGKPVREISRYSTRELISGDFQSRLRAEVTRRTEIRHEPGPVSEPLVERFVSEGRWAGPCPSDMKPGDSELAGDRQTNVLQAAGLSDMAERLIGAFGSLLGSGSGASAPTTGAEAQPGASSSESKAGSAAAPPRSGPSVVDGILDSLLGRRPKSQ